MRRYLWLAIALVIAAALVAPAGLHPADASISVPTVYAHRGGAEVAPENTMGAFRQAHDSWGDQGVWIELDTQLTSDGHLVVIHDHTLDRTTDCEGPVIEHTRVEVVACDAATLWREEGGTWPFEGVPELAAVLAEGKGAEWRLMVELKNIPGESNFDPTGAAAATALVDLVEATGFPRDRLLVQSFFPTSLDQVRLHDPDIPLALLTTSTLPGAPEGVGFTVTENAAYATARGYEVSAPDHRSLDMSAEAVAAAHALGRDVVVWTADDATRIAELAAMDVDGIITNDPATAFAALGP